MTSMYPEVARTLPQWKGCPSHLFLDLEFNGLTPTILGVADETRGYSVPWDSGAFWLAPLLWDPFLPIVGHAILTADRRVLESALGLKIPLSRFQDTMIWHYLCNAELCKGANKGAADEDDEDGGFGPRDVRGEGFMDLWTMASLYTHLPNWKWPWNCKGACGESRPCPRHQPYWYNGLDALALSLAWPQLMQDRTAKGIPDALYDHVARLTILCQHMTDTGVMVDRARIKEIAALIEAEKDRLFPCHEEHRIGKKGQILKGMRDVWDAPFNPRSPKQVTDWFAGREVFLGSTEKDDIELALDQLEPESETHEWLSRLYDYKVSGKGIGPWLSDEYIDSDNLLHSRFIPTASSLGRLASSGPNFQNIPINGKYMKRVREAIIAQPGYKLVTADKKQLELRICLWAAGAPMRIVSGTPQPCGICKKEHVPGGDAFCGLVEAEARMFDEAVEHISIAGFGARKTAKSVTHGGDYGEGMTLLRPSQLDSKRTKAMIDAGALLVYRDWEYCGKLVAFNGVNLAKRLFGDASWGNRKKALQIQDALYSSPSIRPIREWQKRVSHLVQDRNCHHLATGRYLDVSCYPDPVDRLKIALAFEGQGGGAEDAQEGGLRYENEKGHDLPIAQVHDEWIWERPVSETRAESEEFCSRLALPSERLPGFQCPIDVGEGLRWSECK